jgi:hypothetical protein
VSSPGKSAKYAFALDDGAIQYAAAYRFNHRRAQIGRCDKLALRGLVIGK